MSTASLSDWLRTAVLALVAALLLDHVVTTTPASYAAAPAAGTTSAGVAAEASESRG